MTIVKQDTSDNQIKSIEEYFKRWLTETDENLKKHYEEVFKRTKALLIMSAAIFACGLFLSGYTYICGIHGAYGVLFFIVLTGVVLAVSYMSFSAYR